MTSVIDWLTYKSYEAQRLNRPDIPYYKWRQIYKDAVVFEEIFEKHLANLKKTYK